MLKKQNKCCVQDCPAEMKTFEEVASGICSFHKDLLMRNGHFIGVCWECGNIHGIYEVHHRLEGILTSKYLFSKGCSKCSKDPNAESAWITINKHESNTRWAISGDGRLVQDISEPIGKTNKKE